jgi:molecular chaperone DnaK (HSP70)
MWIVGNGKKMEDISLCFRNFEQFKKDYPVLSEKGIIKRIAFDHYEWTETETTLAEYFNWLGEEERKKQEKNQLGIPDGFWNSIATVFRVRENTLSNLASRAKKSIPGETKKFKKIKKMVEEYRKELEQQEEQKQKDAEQEQKDRETFYAIKTLIDETNSDDKKEIKTALDKIKTALT